jgi:hypothetical protein
MIQKTIIIPTRFDSDQREELGRLVVQFIVDRTKSGIDVNGNPFAPYSKNYIKHRDFDGNTLVDLDFTGDMLANIELIGHGVGFLTVGILDQENSLKAEYIENPTGQKSNVPRRSFLGINDSDLNAIIREFSSGNIADSSLAEELTRRILRI